MSIESQAPPPPSDQPPATLLPELPEDVVVEQILTRVPAAGAVRFRAVCRAWRDALTSDHFAEAHRVARAGAQPPEIVFFAPVPAAERSNATAFYTCKLNLTSRKSDKSSDEKAASAHELVTAGNLCATYLILSGTRPCHGLTLLSNFGLSVYHVCNLSTGDHVSLPPCAPANPGEQAIPVSDPGFSVLSCTGLGFDPAAREHKVVRLYEDREMQPRCEVYGLRSGGWRPCAGQVPPLATKCLDGRPPVFVDGCLYWYTGARMNLFNMQARFFSTPEPILSLTVGTEQFGWVDSPVRYIHRLAELDGSLCVVVEGHSGRDEKTYELWTRTAGSGPPPSWSLRCRIMLERLPRPIRSGMWHGRNMLPLAFSTGGKILLVTQRHEVYAYDPESNSADRVFSMGDFLDDDPKLVGLMLKIVLHEDSVVSVRRRPVASDDGGQLKVKVGSSTLARRE